MSGENFLLDPQYPLMIMIALLRLSTNDMGRRAVSLACATAAHC